MTSPQTPQKGEKYLDRLVAYIGIDRFIDQILQGVDMPIDTDSGTYYSQRYQSNFIDKFKEDRRKGKFK